MKETIMCWECEKNPATENHHPIPKVYGGKKTVPLCGLCHGMAHNMNRSMDHASLIRAGLEKAKKNGAVFGRPVGKFYSREEFLKKHNDIVQHLNQGATIRKTAEITKKGVSTVQRVKKEIYKK